MAFKSGKNSFFSVDGTDISSKVDSLSLSRDVNTLETTSFGSDQATFVVGIEGLRFLDLEVMIQQLMELWLDYSMDQQSHSTIDQITHPQLPNTLGMPVTNYTLDSNATDKVSFSFSLIVTGAVTRGTV